MGMLTNFVVKASQPFIIKSNNLILHYRKVRIGENWKWQVRLLKHWKSKWTKKIATGASAYATFKPALLLFVACSSWVSVNFGIWFWFSFFVCSDTDIFGLFTDQELQCVILQICVGHRLRVCIQLLNSLSIFPSLKMQEEILKKDSGVLSLISRSSNRFSFLGIRFNILLTCVCPKSHVTG